MSVSSASDSSASSAPRTLDADVAIGMFNEVSNAGLIRALTGREWVSTRAISEFHPMDWYSVMDLAGEVLPRRFLEQKGCEDTYADKKQIVEASYRKYKRGNGFTLGANKILSYLNRNNEDEVLLLKFKDQTRYVPYDQELFQRLYDERELFQRTSRNVNGRVVDKPKYNCFIPFDKMILAPYLPDGTPMTEAQIRKANTLPTRRSDFEGYCMIDD